MMMELHSIAPFASVGQDFARRSSSSSSSSISTENNKEPVLESLTLDLFEEEVVCLLSNMRDRTSSEQSPALSRKRRYMSSSEDDEEYDDVETFENVDEYDEEFGDEEDWSETRAVSNSSPNGLRGSRASRRKAASGTACEKHKRWKKRCPDDCPMRRSKSQKTSVIMPARSAITLDTSVFTSPSSPVSHSSKPSSSLLSMIRWSSENRSSVTFDDIKDLEKQITLMRTPSPDSEDGGCGFASDDSADSLEEKRTSSPVKVEEPPLLLRAPQPRKGFRVSKILDDEDFTQDIAYSPRNQKKPRTSAKRTAGRKYLPSACERHKLLHAKCPANCPDRLKRDAEMGSKRAEDIPFLPL